MPSGGDHSFETSPFPRVERGGGDRLKTEGLFLNDYHYKRFADSLHSLAPDFQMDRLEIVRHFQTKAAKDVIIILDSYDPELSEVAELLIRLGGVQHGEG